MTQTEIDQLKHTIENQHGGQTHFVEAQTVKETLDGQLVWEGMVCVFDLQDHPSTTRAYAWSSPVKGSSDRRFFAVLHLGSIRSAQDAVRAANVAEHRSQQA